MYSEQASEMSDLKIAIMIELSTIQTYHFDQYIKLFFLLH